MARIRQERLASATITTVGPINNPVELWREFRSRWTEWITRVGSANPVYCLTEPVIARLERSHPDRRAIMDGMAVQAERRLLEICCRVGAAGFWQDRPINFPHLSPPPSRSGIEVLMQSYPPALRNQFRAALDRADEVSPRRSGYVGWLLTEPAYLQEVLLLAQQWSELPANEKPSFPLGRALPWPEIPEGGLPASDVTVQFSSQMNAFLDRWGLINMATWDLPSPQGPLLPNPLPPGAPALPRHGIHICLPLHYPLQGDDDIQREILRLQQQAARELGLNSSLAGLPHFAAYSQILWVAHLERVIVERYGQQPRVKGFMTRLEEAIADALDCSVENVHKMRKAISLCRQGRRAAVKWP
jgi:hypothetical protein